MGSQVQKSDEITFSGEHNIPLQKENSGEATNDSTADPNSPPDYLGLMTCVYEWADSYDSKDWDRLRKVIAPTLRVCSALPCLFLLSHTKYRL